MKKYFLLLTSLLCAAAGWAQTEIRVGVSALGRLDTQSVDVAKEGGEFRIEMHANNMMDATEIAETAYHVIIQEFMEDEVPDIRILRVEMDMETYRGQAWFSLPSNPFGSDRVYNLVGSYGTTVVTQSGRTRVFSISNAGTYRVIPTQWVKIELDGSLGGYDYSLYNSGKKLITMKGTGQGLTFQKRIDAQQYGYGDFKVIAYDGTPMEGVYTAELDPVFTEQSFIFDDEIPTLLPDGGAVDIPCRLTAAGNANVGGIYSLLSKYNSADTYISFWGRNKQLLLNYESGYFFRMRYGPNLSTDEIIHDTRFRAQLCGQDTTFYTKQAGGGAVHNYKVSLSYEDTMDGDFSIRLAGSQQMVNYTLNLDGTPIQTIRGNGKNLAFYSLNQSGTYSVYAHYNSKSWQMGNDIYASANTPIKYAAGNWIEEKTFLSPDGVTSVTDKTYYNGLGIPSQLVQTSLETKDAVTPYYYDNMQRQSRIYKPFYSTATDAAFISTPFDPERYDRFSGQDRFYSYHETVFRPTPDAAADYEYKPGEIYRSTGHSIRHGYFSGGDDVLQLRVTEYGSLKVGDYYPSKALYCQEVKDEDGIARRVYTDIWNRKILERQIPVSAADPVLDTYYVYDELDQLRWVVSPNGSAELRSGVTIERLKGDSFYHKHCFYYDYDKRGNMIQKKLPGRDMEYMVYDEANRLIRHRDGNGSYHPVPGLFIPPGSARLTWQTYTYDDLGRVFRQEEISVSQVVPVDSSPRLIAEYRYGGMRYPTENGDAACFMIPACLAFQPVEGLVTAGDCAVRTSGLKIYEKLAVIPSADTHEIDTYVERSFYYDYKGRIIQIVELNALGGTSRISRKYDFAGNLLAEQESHQAGPNSEPDVLDRTMSCDSRGRVVSMRSTLNGNEAEAATATYEYDIEGRVTKKTQNSAAPAGVSRRLENYFTYNVQGWQTGSLFQIEDDEVWCGSHLYYYDAPTAGSVPSFSGNISEWSWSRVAGDFTRYLYCYDYAGRLRDGKGHSNIYQNPDAFSERDMTYDRNGNRLTRKLYDYSGDLICDQTYSYSGNQRQTMTDNAAETSDQYQYDYNGNLKYSERDTLFYSYNFLNLPSNVHGGENAGVQFSYLSDGTKVKAYSLDVSRGYAYLGSLVYKKLGRSLRLESATHPEGRFVVSSEGIEARYFMTDHLGSVRCVSNNRAVLLEENDYYPFGRQLQNPFLTQADNRYRYNGKELQVLLPHDLLDYGARHYDPDMGIWITQDPLTEKYYGISSYAFCNNNPVRFVDLDGMIWRDVKQAKKLKNNIDNKITSLNNDVAKGHAKIKAGNLKDKQIAKLEKRITEAESRISNLNISKVDIDKLGADQNHTYAFSSISGGEHKVRQGSDGIVLIETSSDALSIHEITHIRQSLDAGGLKFSPGGELYNAGTTAKSQAAMEVDAYQMQYSFDSSFPGSTNGLQGIDVHSVGAITNNGQLVYPFINQYSMDLKQYQREQKKLLGTP